MRVVRTAFLLVSWLAAPALAQTDTERLEQQRREESTDRFRKWLAEDVVYIITDEEKTIFANLATADEKEHFIEQFWRRRDPDLSTSLNEFKEEHYRRITWANDRFTSGIPGWKTDRGRVYILHGPPQELESHPTGGAYQRPYYEGGGITGTYPFEIWRYRHLEGVGYDIELLFVDPSFSDEFRLAMRPEEKDAFLHVGGGDTMLEQMGLAQKSDRPYFNPADTSLLRSPMLFTRAQDMPFQRYETYAFVQRPPTIKYPDLKEMVNVNVTYSNLPFAVRADYFKLNDQQVLVPISLEFKNRDLTFFNSTGSFVAKIAIYGIITDMSNRLIMEFEDDVISSYPPEHLEEGRLLKSMYQKILPLDLKQKYKLDVVVKDVNGNKVGVGRQAIVPPSFSLEGLSVSSMVLTDQIRWLQEVPEKNEMFVIGDIWMIPILDKVFNGSAPLGVYLQIYGNELDQTSLSPSLKVSYRILKGTEAVTEILDEVGETVIFFSGRRVVLVRGLPLDQLAAGEYSVVVEVEDRISGKSVRTQDRFRLEPLSQQAVTR